MRIVAGPWSPTEGAKEVASPVVSQCLANVADPLEEAPELQPISLPSCSAVGRSPWPSPASFVAPQSVVADSLARRRFANHQMVGALSSVPVLLANVGDLREVRCRTTYSGPISAARKNSGLRICGLRGWGRSTGRLQMARRGEEVGTQRQRGTGRQPSWPVPSRTVGRYGTNLDEVVVDGSLRARHQLRIATGVARVGAFKRHRDGLGNRRSRPHRPPMLTIFRCPRREP